MTIPAYATAREDLDLMGFPLFVYLHLLHDLLSPVEMRPVKTEALVARFKCSDDTIGRTLKLLVERGYLERGPRRGGEAIPYRLTYSTPVLSEPPPGEGMIPASVLAERDRVLAGNPILVYTHLLSHLDVLEWREVKRLAWRTRIGLSRNSMSRALKTLVDAGYLERQPGTTCPGSPRLYRLVYSKVP